MPQKGALFFLLYMGPSTKNVATTIRVIVSTTIALITIIKSLELLRFFFSLHQFKVGGGGEDHQTPHHHVDLHHFYGHGHHNKNNNATIIFFSSQQTKVGGEGRTTKPLVIMLIFIIFVVMGTIVEAIM